MIIVNLNTYLLISIIGFFLSKLIYKKFCEKIKKNNTFLFTNTTNTINKFSFINLIYKSCRNLSQKKIGAIIVFIKKDNLDKIIEKAEVINAHINSKLLFSIFIKKSPLHDGAVIIHRNTIKCASAFLHSTEELVPTHFGARHRAAIGHTELFDSVVLIVSESTGNILIAEKGKLKEVKINDLKKELVTSLQNEK